MGTRFPSDICAGKHASLGICVRETRYPGKHMHVTVTLALLCYFYTDK